MIPLRRLALALLLCLALVAGASALPGYPYSQTVEYAACDQAIYQQDVVIHRSAGSAYEETVGGLNVWHLYVGTNCQADYDDLRFTDATGTELFYYLWPDFDAASARFAVRLEGATTAGTLTAHYGNAAATTTSDGDAPYLFFDHFKGTSLDTTKWYQVGSPTVFDSNVTVNSKNEEIKSKQSFGAGTILEGRGSLWNANYHVFGFGVHPYSPFIIYQYGHPTSGNYNARALSSTALGSGWTGVHTWAIHRVASGSAKYYIDGNLVATVTTSTADMPILLQQHDTATGSSVFDYILVRAYSAAPPTATAFLSGPAPETPPVAAFTASPTSGMAPLAVQFTDASTYDPTSWHWDFGDGNISTDQNPSHTYAAAGTYTVTLTATNAHGEDLETKNDLITAWPDTFNVATYADLCKVGTGADGWFLNASYVQTADIQCPAEENFPRIGLNPSTLFTGTYDGNGYEIQNLRLHYSDFHTGMFIVIGETGIVQNVTLVDVDVSGTSSRTGALAGLVLGTVRNCHSSGTVVGADLTGGLIGVLGEYMGTDVGYLESSSSSCTVTKTGQYSTNQGGLVGSMLSGSMVECSATGDVIDGSTAGGLIGIAEGGTTSVSRCSAAGNVTAPDTCWSGTGGLIGKMSGSVSVTDCYAAGGVSAPSRVGGLIGYRKGGTISSCYATGQVAATDEYGTAGGLIGSGGGASSSYWDTETSGQATSYGGVGKTTAEMQALATFADWNIATPATYTDEVWFIVEGEDYPRLAWEGVPEILPPVAAFSAAPKTGTAPLTVQFTDASTNAPTGYFWTFGDGRTSIAQSPSHTYSTAGTYNVSLTATNAGGSDTETKTGYITVSAAPPTAPTAAAGSPAFPYSQQRKETLSFLLMCWGALAFVGVFCVVIFLLMNGAQRGSGGI